MSDDIQTIPVNIEPVVKTEEQSRQDSSRKDSNVEYKFNPEYHRFCSDLGVDIYKRDDIEIAQKASFLYDWAKEKIESDDGTIISSAVHDLVSNLGVQSYRGEALLNYLYEYLRVSRLADNARLQKKADELLGERIKLQHHVRKIEPRISEEELEKRVKEGMKDISSSLKRKVKTQITQVVNKSIKDALRKAGNL